MQRHVGHTVTIYTEAGGCAGEGFTGVLISVERGCVRLMHAVGMPPSCAIGSACTCRGACRCERKERWHGNPMGSIVVIPVCHIVSFVHHSI